MGKTVAPVRKTTEPTSGGSTATPPTRQSRGNAAAQDRLRERAPYSDVYGGNRSRKEAFQVDAGQLTFDAEGTEGGRFHSRTAHVPPGPSGVTIGRGYDLGQHSRVQILEDLGACGVSTSGAAAYAKAAGLKGEDARAWLSRNRQSLPEITPEQQEALFSTTYEEMSADVQRISNKKDVRQKYGAADIDRLNPAIKDSLVDLRYRGDYTGGARAKLQKAAADDDILEVADTLNDRQQWKSVPEDRFRRRAAYIEEEVTSLEMDAYGNGLGPREHGVKWPSLAEMQAEARAKKAGKGAGAADVGRTPAPPARVKPTSPNGGEEPTSPTAGKKPAAKADAPSAAKKPATSTLPTPGKKPAAKAEANAPSATKKPTATKKPAGKKPAASKTPTASPQALAPAKPVAVDDAWSDSTLADYAEYLRIEFNRIQKLALKEGQARAATVLQEVERFVAALRNPDQDTFDVARQPLSKTGIGAWVPPELIPMTRALSALAEGTPGQGDWNSRLGAQEYRTQSDNLASPEASCNITSMAMILERLGVGRADLVSAVDREVKRRWLASKKSRPGADGDLPEGAWGAEVLRYLDQQQGARKGYQRLRGHDTGAQDRRQMAKVYRDDAQMEDLVDFLLSMLGVDRTTITSSAAKLLGRIETSAGERPSVETVRRGGKNTWDSVRARVDATLDAGGSAMISIFHKGAGQSGTHLVVAQQVTSTGMVIDDPYGTIRSDYDRGAKGDAYATPGKTRKTSSLRNVPTMADHNRDGAEDDWTKGAASKLAPNERRGASNEVSDAVLSKAWNYVALYQRGAAKGSAG